jgi:hypothetical protein
VLSGGGAHHAKALILLACGQIAQKGFGCVAGTPTHSASLRHFSCYVNFFIIIIQDFTHFVHLQHKKTIIPFLHLFSGFPDAGY